MTQEPKLILPPSAKKGEQKLFLLPELGLRIARYDGDELVSEREEVAHSWTRNAWNMLFRMYAAAVGSGSGTTHDQGFMNVADIAGTVNSSNSTSASNNIRPPNYIIHIGNGTLAFHVNQALLDSRYTTGWELPSTFTRNQSYNAVTKVWSVSITCEFRNMTGEQQTVREVGLVNQALIAGTNANLLLARDVLDTPEVVEFEQRLFITYNITKDFSAIDV
jgi:hypothetical protein